MKSYLTKLIKFYIKDLGSLFIVCSPEFSLFFVYSTPDLQLVPKKKFISFRLTILRGHVVLNNSPLRHEIPEGWLPEDYQQLLSEQVRSDALNRTLPAGLDNISDGEFLPWMTPAQNEELPPCITRAEEAEKDVVDLHGDEI